MSAPADPGRLRRWGIRALLWGTALQLLAALERAATSTLFP